MLSVSNFRSRNYDSCHDWQPRNRRRIGILHDSYSALNYLAKLPYVDGNRVAVMGLSEGANAINVFMFGRFMEKKDEPKFKAAISFYGRCGRLRRYSRQVKRTGKFNIPLMQIVPEFDEKIVDKCISIKGTPGIDVHVLKGAYHAFDQRDFHEEEYDQIGNKMLYNEAATKKSQKLVQNFLAKYLEK